MVTPGILKVENENLDEFYHYGLLSIKQRL